VHEGWLGRHSYLKAWLPVNSISCAPKIPRHNWSTVRLKETNNNEKHTGVGSLFDLYCHSKITGFECLIHSVTQSVVRLLAGQK
jgi:hypothetical protein